MARWVFVLVITLASSPAFAQDGLRSASLPERDPMNPVPPPPRDLFVAPPDAYRPHPNVPLPGGYVVSGYWPWGRPDSYDIARRSRAQRTPTGMLELQLLPVTAHVYIDGLYVGSVSDLRRLGPGHALEAGAHHVDIRADGFEPIAFDVRIDPAETTTYRNEMKAIAQPSAATRPVASTPVVAKVFYVIPGCYAGDKRPVAATLPRGCSLAKLRAVPPTVSRVSSRTTG